MLKSIYLALLALSLAAGAGRCESYVLVTNKLPLQVTVQSVGRPSPTFLRYGAMTLIGTDLLVMDFTGRLFRNDDADHRLKPSTLPPIPDVNKDSRVRGFDIKYSAEEGCLFVSFEVAGAKDKFSDIYIAKIKINQDRPTEPIGTWTTIYKRSTPLPFTTEGAKMAFAKGKLFIGFGHSSYYDSDNPPQQDVNSLFGKTYQIDLQTGQVDLMSRGHRTILGMAVDSRGEVWATENGEKGGDKLEKLDKDQNYGWPFAELGTRYFTYSTWPNRAGGPTFTDPVFAWVPSIAPSALIEIRDFDNAWNGDLLVGSLKAQTLYRIRLSNDRVVYSEPIWIGHRVRDIVTRPGEILLWTDDGAIVSIKVDKQLLRADRVDQAPAYRNVLFNQCANCHAFTKGAITDFGPSLTDVYGRKIASDRFAYYSSALKAKEGIWDDGTLAGFLTSPELFAPGTTMANPVLKPEEISDIISALRSYKYSGPTAPPLISEDTVAGQP